MIGSPGSGTLIGVSVLVIFNLEASKGASDDSMPLLTSVPYRHLRWKTSGKSFGIWRQFKDNSSRFSELREGAENFEVLSVL